MSSPSFGRRAGFQRLILDLTDAAAHRGGPGSPRRRRAPEVSYRSARFPVAAPMWLAETPAAIASAIVDSSTALVRVQEDRCHDLSRSAGSPHPNSPGGSRCARQRYTGSVPARILVVNGWSNAGKTSLCEWLAKERGFAHIDADHGGIDTHNLRATWTKVEEGDGAAFRDELQGRSSDVALDWPYNPPDALRLVVALQNAGIAVWWLDADPQAAHESFRHRAKGAMKSIAQGIQANFDAHSAANQLWHPVVQRVYGERHLRTLHTDGGRLSDEQIWTTICATEGWHR